MAVVSDSVSVAANARSINVIQGTGMDLLLSPKRISVRANHAGAARGDILTHYMSGLQSKTGNAGAGTNIAAVAGNVDAQTDTLLRGVPAVGAQSLVFQNTTVGALVVNFEYELHE